MGWVGGWWRKISSVEMKARTGERQHPAATKHNGYAVRRAGGPEGVGGGGWVGGWERNIFFESARQKEFTKRNN